MDNFKSACEEARNCRICLGKIPFHPKPVFSIHSHSRILVVGQAPGTRVQATGIPWNDPSGDELRRWLDVGKEQFYDPKIFGIMPMGFCYPGKGKNGDLPPRKECAPQWHSELLGFMPKIELVLLIGSYAQAYYLKGNAKSNLTETVRAFEEYLPRYFPLVHPSPRNRIWQKRNPWFEEKVVPELRIRVSEIIRKNAHGAL
ncbi:uracil-DNA glycosylase family protein [Algoriphagus aestuarii]|nr:uracil-DNA glycosylase family protein [Algoriphagus aestuarii]